MNEGAPKPATFEDVKDFPVIDMKKNSEGVFEFSEQIENAKPYKFEATLSHNIRFKYLDAIKKVAKEKNIKLRTFEKSINGNESKFDITLNGNFVDVQSFLDWMKDFSKTLK